MDSVELALKNSNKKEKALTGDDFSVDDLLDFSNNDDVVFLEDEADLKKQPKRGDDGDITIRWSNDFSTDGEEIGSLPISELSVPMDDLAELEWLSNFVDDSSTQYSAPTKKPLWLTGNRRHPVAPVNEAICFKPPPPVKIRPKRARTVVRVRSFGWPNDSSSSSTTSPSSSSSCPSSPLWLSGSSEFLDESMVRQHQKKKKKKKKKKPSDVWKNAGQKQTQTRRCSHCGVQKTPQWRAGPAGAKTLCNACGVRFKSGRLLPEYRPACSPTFSSELHSNHHRKVIEMRQKKETSDEAVQTHLKTTKVVPSF